jgi:hypothetical protein
MMLEQPNAKFWFVITQNTRIDHAVDVFDCGREPLLDSLCLSQSAGGRADAINVLWQTVALFNRYGHTGAPLEAPRSRQTPHAR